MDVPMIVSFVTLSAFCDTYSFKVKHGDREDRAIHLLVDRKKDCLARLLPDSMGALSKSAIFPFLKILFSCCLSPLCHLPVTCPHSFPLLSLPRDTLTAVIFYYSVSILVQVVKPSPLWILKYTASSLPPHLS